MADLRIGGAGDSGIERFQALREEALRRSRSATGILPPGKTPTVETPFLNPSAEGRAAPLTTRPNAIPDSRSPLGRLIDLRA